MILWPSVRNDIRILRCSLRCSVTDLAPLFRFNDRDPECQCEDCKLWRESTDLLDALPETIFEIEDFVSEKYSVIALLLDRAWCDMHRDYPCSDRARMHEYITGCTCYVCEAYRRLRTWLDDGLQYGWITTHTKQDQ